MAKRPKPTLADHVEAAERREAPRAQARATGSGNGSGTWGNVWVGLVALTVVIAAGAFFYFRFKQLI